MTKIFSELAIERAKVARLTEYHQKLEAEMKAALEVLAREKEKDYLEQQRGCPPRKSYRCEKFKKLGNCIQCWVDYAIRQGKRNVKRRSER